MSEKVRTIELNLSRTIDATPREVFDAWLDPASPGSPWHGVPKAIVNPPRVDALFYSMYQLEGREIAHYGRFLALEEGKKIQHTWVSEATQGLESVVTLTFEAQGDKTVVHVNHAKVPDDEQGRRHEHAWGYVLGRMSARFKKGGDK